MPNKPTLKEIEAEIELLKSLKPRVPEQSMFGGKNWKAIDAQVRVLENNMSDKDIDTFRDDYVYSSAVQAVSWLNGEELDMGDKPSVGWRGSEVNEP